MTVNTRLAPDPIGRRLSPLAARLLPMLVVACFALPLAAAGTSTIVNTRVDAMDRMAVALKTLLGRNVAQPSNATLRKNAGTLSATAKRLLSLFPVGSGVGQTNARAEIWSNWPAFVARATELQLETDRLTEAVQTGDMTKVSTQAKVVGQACAGCHQDFRNEPN